MVNPELDQLPEDIREVVGELVAGISANSWVIEQTARSETPKSSPFYSLERELRASPKLNERFFGEGGRGRLRIIAPNTMAIGLYPGGRRAAAIRYGLFSLPNDRRYDQDKVKTILNGGPTDVVLHGRVDLPEVTGRWIGTISPILGRDYLRNFDVIDFDPQLVEDILLPDTAVAYPLGGKELLHLCVRGSEFLSAYGELLSGMNIRANMGNVNSTG